MDSTIVVALISAIASIITVIITQRTNRKVQSIDDLKKDFKSEMDAHKLESDKTYLTDFISDIENGVEKTEIQIERAHEVFNEYIGLNGNSYVHSHWDKLIEKGLI